MTRSDDKLRKKRLRQLAAIAHERELTGALRKLHHHFDEWQEQKIDAFELSDRIHQFHQQTAREIWKLYANADHDQAALLVSRALRLEILPADEVGQDLVEQLAPLTGYWQDRGPDE